MIALNDKPAYPSDQADKVLVRMPDGMRDRLKDAAKANNRTMNAEIVARLESTFQGFLDKDLTFKMLNDEIERLTHELRSIRSAASPIMAKIGDTVEMQIQHIMEMRGLSFEDALLLLTTRGMTFEDPTPALVLQVAKGTTLAEARALMSTANAFAPAASHVFYEQADVEKTRLLTSEADKAEFLKNPSDH